MVTVCEANCASASLSGDSLQSKLHIGLTCYLLAILWADVRADVTPSQNSVPVIQYQRLPGCYRTLWFVKCKYVSVLVVFKYSGLFFVMIPDLGAAPEPVRDLAFRCKAHLRYMHRSAEQCLIVG